MFPMSHCQHRWLWRDRDGGVRLVLVFDNDVKLMLWIVWWQLGDAGRDVASTLRWPILWGRGRSFVWRSRVMMILSWRDIASVHNVRF